MIEARLQETGVEDMTARFGPRLVEKERCGYLRPTIIHCDSPDRELANTEFMFPFASVVRCPQEEMLRHIGPTRVCSSITGEAGFQHQLVNAPHIDRLTLGSIRTMRL